MSTMKVAWETLRRCLFWVVLGPLAVAFTIVLDEDYGGFTILVFVYFKIHNYI